MSDVPFAFWEHQFKLNGNWRNWAVCKKRSRISDSCYLCDRYPDRYPYFVGLYTVINMTEWESKKGRKYNFSREIFAARLGSKKRPGILKKLKRLHERHGRLRGLVFDVYRSGEKTESCGDEFELVEKVPVKEIDEYCRKVVGDWIDSVNEDLDPENRLTLEEHLKRHPWEPINFEQEIKVMSDEELRALFDGRSSSDDDDEPVSSFASSDDDEEVPF